MLLCYPTKLDVSASLTSLLPHVEGGSSLLASLLPHSAYFLVYFTTLSTCFSIFPRKFTNQLHITGESTFGPATLALLLSWICTGLPKMTHRFELRGATSFIGSTSCEDVSFQAMCKPTRASMGNMHTNRRGFSAYHWKRVPHRCRTNMAHRSWASHCRANMAHMRQSRPGSGLPK